MIFNALHRWLSWKSFARLPKQRASSSRASSSKSLAGSMTIFAEDSMEDLLKGDPWEDCDELAAEDLLEWLADAMQCPPKAGLLGSQLCSTGKSDRVHSMDASTCASLHSRELWSVCSASSAESSPTALQNRAGAWQDSESMSRLPAWSPQTVHKNAARRQQLVEVVSLDSDLPATPRELRAISLSQESSTMMGIATIPLLQRPAPFTPPCNCLTCLLNISCHGQSTNGDGT